ncbi:mannosyl-oligosaccharide glucosidase GCS1 [Aedes aegypti]|uniref:Mannosyl-oligosaccharide glucosidase n=1 Tax=Aedes aegypti TaxID=7159 RepID=A0A6I8U0U3_AEDAE|nr:mannosyl-oligosaccharide glucosidase GCS1 [Aedes aegypti]
MLWGSYRPGVYFGMKSREEHPLLTGLMWYLPSQLRSLSDIRHFCEIGDNLRKYGWTHHDGRNFGVQEIIDGSISLQTSFVKSTQENPFSWTAKIDVKQRKPAQTKTSVSLIWYVAFESIDDGFLNVSTAGHHPQIDAMSFSLGGMEIKFLNNNASVSTDVSSTCTSTNSVDKVKEAIVETFAYKKDGESVKYFLNDKAEQAPCNLAAIMVTFEAPGSFLITMDNASKSSVTIGSSPQQHFQRNLNYHKEKFTEKFDSIFNLEAKGFTAGEVTFAKSILSNLVGGIGYFYGSSKVQSEYNENPINYWKAPLYTAVPSRSFFPRGFLWDEGFHSLLVSTWDVDIALDIMMHWFDLINIDGWIPREQILGSEALAKVPAEFVVQRSSNANPPTFFLTLRYLLNNYEEQLRAPKRQENLKKMFPRLQAWFSWFNKTQKGEVAGSYRWRGRSITPEEINPKTLTSGLDDYPRASHPDNLERHVDLLCWMQLASHVMSDLAKFLGRDDTKYFETYKYLSNVERLNALHLSPRTNTYADYGLHTDKVRLTLIERETGSKWLRDVIQNPKYQLVDNVFGYISLFPFLLKLLPTDSMPLKTTLDNLRDPEVLWTDFGVRSLSKKSTLYMERNTEHDPPYWRGQIWININYLVLSALNHYRNKTGPHKALAQEIYSELRKNIITNMYRQYQRTGYVWENYRDDTGEGKGCYPFTGWSALVVMIMAEIY